MDKYHPEKPFERYADDIVVHCKTEKQAVFVLQQIKNRMNACNLELHPVKTHHIQNFEYDGLFKIFYYSKKLKK